MGFTGQAGGLKWSKNRFLVVYFWSVFQEGRGKRFLCIFGVLRCIGRLFFEQILETCGLLAKSADPRFLHTVQRFGLIFKVLGLPKHGKNSKKGVLEIMVF